MRIGFLLLRDTYLKIMGPLILTAIERGQDALLLYSANSADGPKADQFMNEEKLEALIRQGARAVKIDLNELGRLKEKYEFDILVTLEGFYVLHSHLKAIGLLRESGAIVVSLGQFYENVRHSLESLKHFDKTYYLSQYGIDTHFAIGRGDQNGETLKAKFSGHYEACGSPMFDQLKAIDGLQFKRELGIPVDKRVVVLFAPVITPETRWRDLILRGRNRARRILRIFKERKWEYLMDGLVAPSFEEMVQGIRKFCDRNNAVLVVKSRKKQRDDEQIKQMADFYVTGEQDVYYPEFTSFRLLSAADLCITVMSMSVLESVAAGVPVLNIYIPYSEYKVPPSPLQPHDGQYFQAVMGLDKEGPFNFASCITHIDPAQAVKWFQNMNIDDVSIDPGKANEYARKFLGIENRSSSDRILDSLEELHKHRSLHTIFVGQDV